MAVRTIVFITETQCLLRASSAVTISGIRAIWSARLSGRATPLLVVILGNGNAALCGPVGDPPPAFLDLDVARVEKICSTALSEPDCHSALRFLATEIPEVEAPVPGVRNEGFFATHELLRGVPVFRPRNSRRAIATSQCASLDVCRTPPPSIRPSSPGSTCTCRSRAYLPD
jgi:hypothetical protein